MNLWTHKWSWGCLAVLASVSSIAHADGPAKGAPDKAASATHSTQPQNAVSAKVAFLGVAVQPLHPAFWAHLRDLAEKRYGVIVEEVGPGTPADKAGLQTHDILMMFGDQKVYNPHQLHSLVHAAKPGDRVKLQLLREGMPQEVQVTLGEHAPAPKHSGRASQQPQHAAGGWTTLDSMSIKKLDEGKYQVEIDYESVDNKVQHQAFVGTRDEIRRDILLRKDLPEGERNDLLHALDMATGDRPAPDVIITPDGKLIWDLNGFNAF